MVKLMLEMVEMVKMMLEVLSQVNNTLQYYLENQFVRRRHLVHNLKVVHLMVDMVKIMVEIEMLVEMVEMVSV